MFGICLESSHGRGMGHLFRMLNLAGLFRARGVPFILLLNDHAPALELAARADMPFETVPLGEAGGQWIEDAIRRHGIQTWIYDRLDTTLSDAAAVKGAGIPLATFDDHGPGAALADLHIAALALDETQALQGKRVLRGIDYLILNPEIARFRRERSKIDSLVITLGGSDTYGATVEAVRILRDPPIPVTVIVGPAFRHHAELQAVMPRSFAVKTSVPSLIEEFSHHDLAITGSGITPFEAAASGLPVITIANEPFEVPVARHLARLGASRYAGRFAELDKAAFENLEAAASMSRNGLDHVPLNGLERVCEALLALWKEPGQPGIAVP